MRGFTLIETLVALTLLSLALGLAALVCTGLLPAARFEAAGREIAGTVRQARTLARLTGTPQAVLIDLERRTWGIEGRPARPLPADATLRVLDPETGEIRRGLYRIPFTPAGGLGGGTLLLTRDDRTLRIDLDPLAGARLSRLPAP